MNTLTEKAKHNLKYLFEMGENDTFNSERGKLVPQEDFIQVNNTVDLEYAVYFTFHHYISCNDTNSFYDDNIIKKLEDMDATIASDTNNALDQVSAKLEDFETRIADLEEARVSVKGFKK